MITNPPTGLAVCLGGAGTFSVTASGTGLTYQWMKDKSPLSDGQTISGTTSSELSLSSVQSGDAGTYTVDVTNSCGTVTSDGATLTVNTGPTIDTQPASQTVCSGSAVKFAVAASGTGTLSYQWKKNSISIPQANGATYSIASVTPTDAGTYKVDVTNSCGKVTSGGATLTVNALPGVPSMPSGPKSGYAFVPYSYTTSAIDPSRGQIKYTFDWGDGTTFVTDPVKSGTIGSASHIWSKAGPFKVKAMASDSSCASGWSIPLAIKIAANSPPNTPSIPTGLTSGKIGTRYSYSTSAIDLDKDKIKYTFDWGDGITFVTALANSGKSETASHKWSKAGTYQVKAMATDRKGASSGWSGSRVVKIGI